MSTRATYLFKGDEYRPDVCIYIHHDGYQEGGAYYFYNAFVAGSGYVNAESMIRGNDRAEVTDSHDAHGDTEYRYTLNGNTLQVEERHTLIEFGSYPDGWRTIFTGDWCDFINKHISSDWIDGDFRPIRRIDLGHSKGLAHTPESLQAELDKELRLCGMWVTNGNEPEGHDSANMRSLKDKIKTMRDLLASYGEPAWKAAA